MISLVVPKGSEDRYINFRNFFIGPYGSNMVSEGDVIDLPAEMSSMTETKGIWHENAVVHEKVSGVLRYHPFLSGATRTPLTGNPAYPDCVTFPTWLNLSKTYPNTQKALYGFGVDHATGMSIGNVSPYLWWQYALERNSVDPNLWNLYAITGQGLTPNASWGSTVYELLSIDTVDSTAYHAHERITTMKSFTYVGGINWFEKQSFQTIKDYILARPVFSTQIVTNRTLPYYYARIPSGTTLSPSEIKGHIDAVVAQLVEGFPIPDDDYGDLAMIASEKVNANKVNMIAFLRDLRHPTEMIPKLRNLQKLKTIAGNYLSVKYGVLPTIDDIKSIFAACSRIAPYLDRNGFQVYTAMTTNTQEGNDVTYTCEQRIKLAIDNEDSEFQALIGRLESMGTLPTLQNVWDLVPYSFVIDWLVDVGGLLQRVDTRLRLMRLNIRYVTMSRKTKIEGILTWDASHNYEGNVIVEQYHRWVSDQCPVPLLSLDSTFQDFSHWLESGALLTQRIKH